MKRFREVNHLLYLISLVGVLGIFLGSQVAFAAQEISNLSLLPPLNQEEPPPEEPPEEDFFPFCLPAL